MKAERLVEIMRHVPEGGDWRDLPADLQAEAMGASLHASGGRTSYFRRLHSGRPAPTIVGSPTQKSTLLWHPFVDRAISAEEAALLQSYPATIERPATMTDLVALDLFAGTGWGVACHRLGVEEYGVEIMPEARATRAANGMSTIYADVWEGLRTGAESAIDYNLLIASPPCQTFSMAGSGAGRKALDEVLQAIDERQYVDPDRLREFGEKHDPRTALVLTPLAHVYRDAPLFVVLEQVPPVLPVWERYAEEMRQWGYSVWTGNLQAEQYGVPQTRKRAILIARADGVEAAPPAPTHSRYYSRDPQRLDEGVLPWVSMAEALGWGMTERPFITAGNAVGRAEGVGGSGAKAAILREQNRGRWAVRTSIGEPKVDGRNGTHELDPAVRPMHTVTTKVGDVRVIEREKNRGAWAMRTNQGNPRDGYNERDLADPSPTVNVVDGKRVMRSNFSAGGTKGATAAERGRTMRDMEEPSVTMSGKPGHWVTAGEVRDIHIDPAKPATTVAGDPRLSSRDHHEHGAQAGRATRVSVDEAAALQSYPRDFIWDAAVVDPETGKSRPMTKTKQFLQIGNAVPPLLAEAILRTLI